VASTVLPASAVDNELSRISPVPLDWSSSISPLAVQGYRFVSSNRAARPLAVSSSSEWIEIREAAGISSTPSLDLMHRGERQTTLLAEAFHPDFLLLDDKAAHAEATRFATYSDISMTLRKYSIS
jgi:hypothetical protein